MPSQKPYHKPTSIDEAYSNPRYQGKILIEVKGKLYGTYSEERAIKLIKKLEQKFPGETVKTTVAPRGVM